MKVVICDDNIEDLEKVERLLIKYRESSLKPSFVVEKFSSAVNLYQKISEKKLADIYILDLIMEEKTGIDIGARIREVSSESIIIFLTSSDDFALEAYGVYAIRYLLKPVSEEHFFEAMDYAFSYTKKNEVPIFQVKTKEGPVSVPYSKIEYIENYSRMLNVCLTNGENIRSIFIRKSFDEEIKEIAGDSDFLKVHKSFLINMDHVKKLAQGSVIMESGRSIPVSKARAADVRREYLLFASERYR